MVSDVRKSAARLYINNFVDPGRQNTMDLLLVISLFNLTTGTTKQSTCCGTVRSNHRLREFRAFNPVLSRLTRLMSQNGGIFQIRKPADMGRFIQSQWKTTHGIFMSMVISRGKRLGSGYYGCWVSGNCRIDCSTNNEYRSCKTVNLEEIMGLILGRCGKYKFRKP